MKLVSLLQFFLITMSSVVDMQAAAVPDPDRNSTVPTGWTWWRDQTPAEMNTNRHAGFRILSLEPSPSLSGTFDAVMVRNAGAYQRSDGWWYGFTAQQVLDKVAEQNGRITDLEPITVNGQRYFNFALIRNEGVAAKAWWWNYDRTPQQITDEINQHGIRLVSLKAYLVGGQTLYSYVGIANSGIDGSAWWWSPNVSFQTVVDQLKANDARLIDLDVHPNGNLSVIMVKNDGAAWWWGAGLNYDEVVQLYSVTASRLTTLKSYLVNGQRRYAVITIDNADAETRRLRDLIYRCFDNPVFGDKTIRGFQVREVGGPVLADMAGSFPFQPLSTLKLLPYLNAWMEIDKGTESLSSILHWTESTIDNPKTSVDERAYTSCLTPGALNTRAGSAPFSTALPTMMWESHGRTLDAFLTRFGPDHLTAVANKLGLRDTQMYFGCPDASTSTPWAANRSTLSDFARMFEGVEKLQFVTKASSRLGFLDNMINLNYAGASYASPITGHTTGPLRNDYLMSIVQREAGPSKQWLVDEFMRHVVVRGKGGSGGPSGNEIGYSDFLYVSLPFKQNGNIVQKTFTAGWFIYDMVTPKGCPDTLSNDNGPCEAIWGPEWADLAVFKAEMHTLPIRMALATWDVPAPVIESIKYLNGLVTITWKSEPGATYQVQSKPSLNSTQWTALNGNVAAKGTTSSKVIANLRPSLQAYYRVELLP